MKKIIFIILLGSTWSLFAQSPQSLEQHPVRYLNGRESSSQTDTVRIKKNGYYIGFGINSSILLGKQGYYLSITPDFGGVSILYFPQSYISFGVDGGYTFYMTNIGKIKFSLNSELALNYYKNKYSLQNFRHYNKYLVSSVKVTFLTLSINVLPSLYYPINKKSGIALFVGIGLDNNYKIGQRTITYALPKEKTDKWLDLDVLTPTRLFFYGNIIGRIAYYRKINNHKYGIYIGIGLKDITSNIFNQGYNGRKVSDGRNVTRQTILRYGITYKF